MNFFRKNQNYWPKKNIRLMTFLSTPCTFKIMNARYFCRNDSFKAPQSHPSITNERFISHSQERWIWWYSKQFSSNIKQMIFQKEDLVYKHSSNDKLSFILRSLEVYGNIWCKEHTKTFLQGIVVLHCWIYLNVSPYKISLNKCVNCWLSISVHCCNISIISRA